MAGFSTDGVILIDRKTPLPPRVSSVFDQVSTIFKISRDELLDIVTYSNNHNYSDISYITGSDFKKISGLIKLLGFFFNKKIKVFIDVGDNKRILLLHSTSCRAPGRDYEMLNVRFKPYNIIQGAVVDLEYRDISILGYNPLLLTGRLEGVSLETISAEVRRPDGWGLY